MKCKKVLSFLLIIFICMIAISAVSAAEDTAREIISAENNISVEDTMDIRETIVEDTKSNENAVDIEDATDVGENNSVDTLDIEDSMEDEENNGVGIIDSEDALIDKNIAKSTLGSPNHDDFDWLQELINNDTDGVLYLDRDYHYYGWYYGAGVTIDRDLIIYGNGHTLDGGGYGRIVTVTGDHAVELHDLRFANAYTGMGVDYGAAINGNKYTKAINCNFSNNRAYYGGAMAYGAAINCYFENCNYACDYDEREYNDCGGGALYRADAYNCTFFKCSSLWGGAIYDGVAVNCHFNQNKAGAGGAACQSIVINCTFTNNQVFDTKEWFPDGPDIQSTGYLDCNPDTSGNHNYEFNEAIFNVGDLHTNKSEIKYFISIGRYETDNYGRTYFEEIPFIDVSLALFKDNQVIERYSCKSGDYLDFNLDNGNYTLEMKVKNSKLNFIPSKNITIEVAPYDFSYLQKIISDTKLKEIDFDGDFAFNPNTDSTLVNGIIIARDVTINGNGHFMDAKGLARIFNVQGNHKVVFNNITLLNGKTGDYGYGGAIWGNSTAINCNFINNTGDYGGAISGVNAYGCIFENNTGYWGGAGYSGNYYNSTFISNSVPAYRNGGAVYYEYPAIQGFLMNCTFINNTENNGYKSLEYGLAVGCTFINAMGEFDHNTYVSPNIVANDTFIRYNSNNTFPFKIMAGSEVPGVNTTFTVYKYDEINNPQYLDKFYALSGSPIVFNYTPARYKLALSLGDFPEVAPYEVFVYVSKYSFTDLKNLIESSSSKTITLDGDYIFNPSTDSALVDGIVIDRDLTINGNGHFIDALAKARIFKIEGNHDMVFNNISFERAYAGSGSYGAAIWGNSTAINCNFINNTADNGGAIADVTSIGSTFKNNHAECRGGAAWGGNHFNSTFISNDAELGLGGAVQLMAGEPGFLINCTFKDNFVTLQNSSLGEGVAIGCTFINANGYYDHNTCEYPTIKADNVTYIREKSSEPLTYKLMAGDYEVPGLKTTFTIYNSRNPDSPKLIEKRYILSGQDLILNYSSGKYKIEISLDDFPESGTVETDVYVARYYFSELKDLIKNSDSDEIVLEGDCFYNPNTDSTLADGIIIDRDIIINGNGHTVDALKYTYIFKIDDNANVTFKNMILENGDNGDRSSVGAIWGNATAINCTFKNNYGVLCGAIANSDSYNCTFLNNSGHNAGAMAYGNAYDCNFTINSGYEGGAGWSGNYFNCIFKNNTCGVLYSGAVSGDQATFLVNCTFNANNAQTGYSSLYKCVALDCRFINSNGRFDENYEEPRYILSNDTEIQYDSGKPFEFKAIAGGYAINGLITTLTIYNASLSENPKFIEKIYLKSDEDLVVNYTPGTYKVVLSVDNYLQIDTVEKMLYVTKANTNISLNPTNIEMYYFDSAGLLVNLTDSSGKPVSNAKIEVEYNDYSYNTNGEGIVIVSIRNVPATASNVTIKYGGNDFYNASEAVVTIDFKKMPSTIIASDNHSVNYNNIADFINITLVDANGYPIGGFDVKVDINGEKTFTTDALGNIKVPTYGLDEGNYTVNVVFDNDYFVKSNKTIDLNIYRLTHISGDLNRTYNIKESSDNDLTVTIEYYDNGTYRPLTDGEFAVELNGVNRTFISDEKGQINIPTNGFAAGSHAINVFFLGNEALPEDLYIANVQINKAEPRVKGSNMTTKYGLDTWFNVSLEDEYGNPIKGINIVNVELNGEANNYATNNEGIVSISTKDLPVGTYEVNMRFYGNENFTEASSKATILVDRDNSILSSDNITTSYSSGDNLIIKLTDSLGRAIYGANLTVDLEGIEYYFTSEKGEIFVPVSKLAAGKYVAEISFAGDECYGPSSLLATVTINKGTPHIYAKSDLIVYGHEGYLNISFEDESQNPIKGYNIINVKLNGESDNYVTDENGTISILVKDLPRGHNYAVLTFLGNENFTSAENNYPVVVIRANTSLSSDGLTINYGQEGYITVNLTDSLGMPIVGANLTVKFNGNETYTTDGNGQIMIEIKDINAGNYSADISFDDEDHYWPSNLTVNFTINKAPTQVITDTNLIRTIYGLEKYFNISLQDDMGNPIKGVHILNVEINGEKKQYETDENGTAIVSIKDLPVDNYWVTLSYDGNQNLLESTNYLRIIVSKQGTKLSSDNITTSFNSGEKLIVNLTDALGNPLSGLPVTYGLFDTKTLITNENGTIEIPTDGLVPETYTLLFSFDGNDNYNQSSLMAKILITKNYTPMNINWTIVDNDVDISVELDPNATGIVQLQIIGPEEYITYAEIVNGIAVSHNVLTKGEYQVVAIYDGDEYFYPVFANDTFKVEGHIKDNTSISSIARVDNYTVTITTNVNNTATGFVTIEILGQTFIVPVNEGQAIFTYDFKPGTYSANVSYLGDENFNNASANVSFTVTEQVVELKNTTISVDVNSVENNVTITATVDTSASGLVEFNIEGKTVYIPVSNGKAVYTTSLAAGDYNAIVTYMGDSKFNANTSSQRFTVRDHIKKNTTITGNVTIDAYDVVLTVEVNENATGFVEFILNNNSTFVKISKGKAALNIILLPGEYAITANYLGDDDYNANSTTITFTVEEKAKENTPIALNVDVLENNVTFTADVNSDATGIVKFNVTGDEEYVLYVDVIDGQAVLKDVFGVGDYTVVITYMGDEKYNLNSTSKDFTVVGHIKEDTSISSIARVDNYTVTITTNVNNTATGFVTIEILGQTFIVPVNEGQAIFTYDFKLGTYSANVIYLGDENFNNASTDVSFTVTEQVVELKNTTISVDVNCVENNVTITATVDTSASGLVEFKIEGKTVYIPVSNGKAVYTTSLAAGDYNAIVTYMGDSKFNTNTSSQRFTVTDHIKKNTTITANVTIDGQNVTLTVNVDKDATGFVEFIINNNSLYEKISQGKAALNTTLMPGEYAIKASYLGDDNFNANSTIIEFAVEAPIPITPNATINITFEDEKIVIIKLADLDGNAIANANVEVSVNGINTTVITDNNGEVRLTVSGNTTVLASYKDANNLTVTNSAKLTVIDNYVNVTINRTATNINYENMVTTAVMSKIDGKIGEYFKFRLVDANGKPLANTPMKIGFNGVIYDEKDGIVTDENGWAKLQINLGYKGDYTFAISFLGNDLYEASFAVAKITVKVQTPQLVVPNKSYSASAKTKTLTATFKTSKGNVLAGKKISFTVNGKTYTAKTNAKGVVSVKVSLNKKGTYSFVAKFAGDSTYAAISKKATLTLK